METISLIFLVVVLGGLLTAGLLSRRSISTSGNPHSFLHFLFKSKTRDLPKSVRLGMKIRYWLGTVLVIFIMFSLQFLGLWPIFSTVKFQFTFRPHSKAYEKLTMEAPFETAFHRDIMYNIQPKTWSIHLELISTNKATRVMNIVFPGLKATYPWKRGSDWPRETILGLEDLLGWMKDDAGLDAANSNVQEEAKNLMALFKRYETIPPASFEEFHQQIQIAMTAFDLSGWAGTGVRFYFPYFMVFTLLLLVSTIIWTHWWGFKRVREMQLNGPDGKAATSSETIQLKISPVQATRICKSCAKPLPKDAPEGLCPKCLIGAAFESQSGVATELGQPPGSPRPAPPAPADIAKYFPQLEIRELLGAGGMGVVYKARQPNLDRFVALKILPIDTGRDPHFAERFSREAKALARLNHPNIVGVYDFGQADGFYFLLMEYVDGVNLRQMEKAQRLTPGQAMAIVPKICDALQYAHDEGIVHRDIKPANILIDKKGRVKIADFGLAKLLGKQLADLNLTQANVVMGTAHYMAPEQMDRPLEVDSRADIYSLGVVFYEMLTGELPLGRFALPSEKVQVDVRFDEIVLRSLERDVERRYQHVSEVKTGVENISGTSQQPSLSAPAADVAASSKEATAAPVENQTASKWLFWPIAIGVLLLSWLIPAALWNFADLGVLIAVLLMGALFTVLTYWGVQRMPALAQCWMKLNRPGKCVNLVFGVGVAALGFFFLLGALETRWEARSLNWNSAGQSSEEFAASHKGEEYKLIRQLSAFKDQVPTVELSPNGGFSSGGWNIGGVFGKIGPFKDLWSPMSANTSLLMAFFCLIQVVASLTLPWRLRFWLGGPTMTAYLRCALPLTVAALFSGFGTYEMHAMRQIFNLSATWDASLPPP